MQPAQLRSLRRRGKQRVSPIEAQCGIIRMRYIEKELKIVVIAKCSRLLRSLPQCASSVLTIAIAGCPRTRESGSRAKRCGADGMGGCTRSRVCIHVLFSAKRTSRVRGKNIVVCALASAASTDSSRISLFLSLSAREHFSSADSFVAAPTAIAFLLPTASSAWENGKARRDKLD